MSYDKTDQDLGKSDYFAGVLSPFTVIVWKIAAWIFFRNSPFVRYPIK